MRNELLKELRLEDLSGSSLELAEAIGMEGFIRLVPKNYPMQSVKSMMTL